MSLIPWVVFAVVDRAAPSPQWAALSAAATAVIIAWPSIVARSPRTLDLAAIVLFVALAVAAFMVGPEGQEVIAHYGRTIVTGALALFVFATLPFRPFTEQYARLSVPRDLWDTPRFKHVNRVLSAGWGAAFAFMTVCHLIAAGSPDDRRLSTIFNWLLPIAAIILMIRVTERYRARARDSARAAASTDSGTPGAHREPT
ncbi:hypothetical protein ACFXEL_32820 [Streptomyces sp. NPDC059382]|uniref:hypothetical protein n=1 Tax=Streptomyces sp. NPDC059382 TaxID=3346816 RepID=UPI0036A58C47